MKPQCALMALAGWAALALPAAAQSTETEPNNTKAQANAVLMPAGSPITGNSTSDTGAGCDYFRITTSPAPLGIYRHRLTITTSGTPGHTGTIRGLSQTNGVVGSVDMPAQTSSPATSPANFNQWYGFGKAESIYYMVTGTPATTANYTVTYSVSFAPLTDLGTFAPGCITITTVGQGHDTDTEIMVYSATMDGMPGYLNDDTPPGDLQSTLSRIYAPGIYYFAISKYSLCDSRPSPTDDATRSGVVADFSGAVIELDDATNVPMSFAVIDANGTHAFPATRPGPFDVLWYRFIVTAPTTECFTRAAQQAAGFWTRGGPNGVADITECIADWDRDQHVAPSDVAAFVAAWYHSVQSACNMDADIDCNGSVNPADVAFFVQHWFAAAQNPASQGCLP